MRDWSTSQSESFPEPGSELQTPVRYKMSKMSWAASSQDGSLGPSIKWVVLDKRSSMVKTRVLLSKSRKPVTKSRTRWDLGLLGTGRWSRRPASGLLLLLHGEQEEVAFMKYLTSERMDDHQKHQVMKEIPGYQDRLDEWTHWRTWEQTGVGEGEGSDPGIRNHGPGSQCPTEV